MRPFRSFLLLLIFLACFTGLHYIIPAFKGFPSISEFVPGSLINNLKSGNKSNGLIPIKLTDTTRIVTSDTFVLSGLVTSIPEKLSDYRLSRFLDSLRYSRGQVRIIYYGDSQIEGDRITSYLRHVLQKGRGGTGPGLFLPLMPVMYTKSIWLRSSSNWKRYNYLSYKAGEISHRNLGPFMAICRYLPDKDTAREIEKAYVKIRPSSFADSATATYDKLRIFYGNTAGKVNISIKGDDNLLYSDSLKRGDGYNEINCRLEGKKDITIEFRGRVSPDIYGISIESDSGVVVDNIPQRGSAGLEFTMVNRNNLREAYKKLSPDLIILQYGLNIVKNVREDYLYYEKGLIRQLSLIKNLSPLTSILVVGVTDMAANEGDSIKSYNNIPFIVEAQKKATKKVEVFFWDSYMAMGGKSSIIKWSGKKPPLAQKDFVHLTYQGADTLSKLLVSSLFTVHPIDSVSPKPVKINIPEPPVIVPDIQTPGLFKSLASSVLSYNHDKTFVFTSPAFWIFFLIVLLGYSIVYKKMHIRNIYLFLVSLFFYYKAGGLFLFILIFVTIIDYTCGLLIFNSKRQGARRFFVLLSIISNLGLLGYFKYTSFIITSINGLFGTHFVVYDLLSAFSNSFLGSTFD